MPVRQPYPLGDDEHGQFVQTNTVWPVQDTDVDWDDTFQLTVSSTSVPIGALIAGHNYAFITVETNAVRFRLDNLAPTTTVGHPLEAGSILKLTSFKELDQVRFIRRDGADSILTISIGNRR